MAKLRKRIIKGKTYYYLEHSMKVEGKVEKKELYIGKEIPENIEELKEDFVTAIYKENWKDNLERIKENYSKEKKLVPDSAWKKEIENFAIRFTYDTQRIEGSTLTLKETADLLERRVTPKEKPLNDVKETEAHKNLLEEILSFEKDLSLSIVIYWHKKLLQETKQDIAGKIRRHQIEIARSKFKPPLAAELDFMLKEFFEWYKKSRKKFNPVELAALVHLNFVTIHPFADGNGRMSRLMMNFILNKYDYPMFNIHYIGRNSYYDALEKSQTKQKEIFFLRWFVKRYIKENKKYL